jgi:hypothetical protein
MGARESSARTWMRLTRELSRWTGIPASANICKPILSPGILLPSFLSAFSFLEPDNISLSSSSPLYNYRPIVEQLSSNPISPGSISSRKNTPALIQVNKSPHYYTYNTAHPFYSSRWTFSRDIHLISGRNAAFPITLAPTSSACENYRA